MPKVAAHRTVYGARLLIENYSVEFLYHLQAPHTHMHSTQRGRASGQLRTPSGGEGMNRSAASCTRSSAVRSQQLRCPAVVIAVGAPCRVRRSQGHHPLHATGTTSALWHIPRTIRGRSRFRPCIASAAEPWRRRNLSSGCAMPSPPSGLSNARKNPSVHRMGQTHPRVP